MNVWFNRDLANVSVQDALQRYELLRSLLLAAPEELRQRGKLNLIDPLLPSADPTEHATAARVFNQLGTSLARIGLTTAESTDFWTFCAALAHLCCVRMDSGEQLLGESSWEFCEFDLPNLTPPCCQMRCPARSRRTKSP